MHPDAPTQGGTTLADSPFVPGPRVQREGAGSGPLAGLRFAAKDLYDVAGEVTRGGNADWAADARPALATAWAIRRLLDSGASLDGKTITDELACGLLGNTSGDGMPVNPLSPTRVPGGSSSGSASAVAAGLVDFAIGTDTGGSVRVPAAFCGLYGMRPTHGAIPLAGCLALAPAFDTCGWFAREPGLLARVGDMLLPPPLHDPEATPVRLLHANDLFDLCVPPVAATLHAAAAKLGSLPVDACAGAPSDHPDAFWPFQGRQMWNTFGDWYHARPRRMQPGNDARFAAAAAITAAQVQAADPIRRRIAAHLGRLLGSDGVLLVPTTHDFAPARDATLDELEAFRRNAHVNLAIAGLCGLPQLTVPLAARDDQGRPVGVGLSLLSARGNDRLLLRLAGELARSLD
ncbi:MAG: amidase [Betaproteobacteria bacterium]|jgi:amidase|nr:amidase [Betaproteobacteria bacterium]